MRRWLFRILICLVLGLVSTVAVAWGLAVKFGYFALNYETPRYGGVIEDVGRAIT